MIDRSVDSGDQEKDLRDVLSSPGSGGAETSRRRWRSSSTSALDSRLSMSEASGPALMLLLEIWIQDLTSKTWKHQINYVLH